MSALRRLKWTRVVAPANDRELAPLVAAGLAAVRPMPKKQAEFRLTAAGAQKLCPEEPTC
jgi:hypothetical protein